MRACYAVQKRSSYYENMVVVGEVPVKLELNDEPKCLGPRGWSGRVRIERQSGL